MPYSKDQKAFLAQMGHNIRRIRESKGWSQEGFALEADIHRTYYGAVERGLRNVSSFNLRKIATTLGVTVGDFFPK